VSRQPFADEFRRTTHQIAGHIMKERQARSFDFRTPSLGSFYAYSLTWTPGTVVLAGDLDELTITHWHALWTFKEGMAWLADSHWDYLLGKAKRNEVPDVEATVDFIVNWARDELSSGSPSLANRLAQACDAGKAWGAGLWRIVRRRLTDDLVPMDEREVAEFCQDLGFDDYYGSRRPHPHALMQITAIQRAARMIIAELWPYEWL
jgi:hypothetical protein